MSYYAHLDKIIAEHDAYNASLPPWTAADFAEELAALSQYEAFGGHLPTPTDEDVARHFKERLRTVYEIEAELKGNNR